jgi:hypothetical protein
MSQELSLDEDRLSSMTSSMAGGNIQLCLLAYQNLNCV